MKKKQLTIADLNGMTDMLLQCREAMNAQYETYDTLKQQYYTQKAELEAAMKENGLTQVRRDNATVSISTQKGLEVQDQNKLMAWLRSHKYGHVIQERVEPVAMRTLSRQLVKAGDIPDGTTVVEKEIMKVIDKKENDAEQDTEE